MHSSIMKSMNMTNVFLRHLALGYTKEMITNLRGDAFRRKEFGEKTK